MSKKSLTTRQASDLLRTLQSRFEANMQRHPKRRWDEVRDSLKAASSKLWSLWEMEKTGGEPDVVDTGADASGLSFWDCSPESPEGRRSLCYDGAALQARKKNKPEGSAVERAQAMGIELLTEEQYLALQALGEFDTKTSSWLLTETDLRERGGAIFGDRRFGRVFIYHNGADSYYGARGFRGRLLL